MKMKLETIKNRLYDFKTANNIALMFYNMNLDCEVVESKVSLGHAEIKVPEIIIPEVTKLLDEYFHLQQLAKIIKTNKKTN